MKCIEFNFEKEYINEFVNLPKKLYTKNDNMEDEKEMKEILTNNHPLSRYFKLNKFLVYKENKVVARFAITTYPNDNTAYLGFFECINDSKVAKYLFDEAYKFAIKNNYNKIIGPVNASFWIKYRLKINMFDLPPYTGEPYNKDYYLKLFQENNYNIVEHYTSNIYESIDECYTNEKYKLRYKQFINNGYEIISPDINNFDKVLKELYFLITKLYSDFPIYKDLSLEDFFKVFEGYKKIIDTSMVKVAYFKGKMVGFFISVPNYSNKVYHLSLLNLIKILQIKNKPKQYVMLYMGVDSEHTGLGSALVYSIMKELAKSKLTSIGALARDGKITQNYVKDLIKNRYEYVLLEKVVK